MSQWYEVVNGIELRQGDIIFGCPVLVPHYSDEDTNELSGEIQDIDTIILTQSCDLEHGKVERVLLCPIDSIHEAIAANDFLKSSDRREALRQGNIPGLHLLEEIKIDHYPMLDRPLLVVSFFQPVTLPLLYLQSIASSRSPRPRLLSPYREHLAQAFARYYMRVGLPADIEKAMRSSINTHPPCILFKCSLLLEISFLPGAKV